MLLDDGLYLDFSSPHNHLWQAFLSVHKSELLNPLDLIFYNY